MDVKVGSGHIYTLLFADDQLIIAEDEEDATHLVRNKRDTDYESIISSFRWNKRKCQTKRNTHTHVSLYIHGTIIENCVKTNGTV